jgi:hypothetical protein
MLQCLVLPSDTRHISKCAHRALSLMLAPGLSQRTWLRPMTRPLLVAIAGFINHCFSNPCHIVLLLARLCPPFLGNIHTCCAHLPLFSISSSFQSSSSRSPLSVPPVIIMAIHPTDETPHNASVPQPINIEAWTEQATASLGELIISAPGELLGATVQLEIPLDVHPVVPAATAAKGAGANYYARKEPLRRDSMKGRERMIKGNEGSRRRQRWENGMRHHHHHQVPIA